MQDEVWRRIESFEGYSVSDCGRVRRDSSGYILNQQINQFGVPNVGLMQNGRQRKLSVSRLVATEFVPRLGWQRESFNTPINLDGDRLNNYVPNLRWRPRWFAVDYLRQFVTGPRGFAVPIEDITSGEQFETSWPAALKFGLLDHEILLATMNRTYVWPTFQTFRVL